MRRARAGASGLRRVAVLVALLGAVASPEVALGQTTDATTVGPDTSASAPASAPDAEAAGASDGAAVSSAAAAGASDGAAVSSADGADGLAAPLPPPPDEPLPAPTASSAGEPATGSAATSAAPPAEVDATTAAWSEPEPPARALPFGGRAYVARYSRRPLTIGEGVLRIDSGSAGRFGGGGGGFGINASVGFGAHLGITSDLQIGVSLGVGSGAPVAMRDPVLAGTLRFFHDDAVDLGVEVSVRAPIITTGDTVVRAGVPLVVRGGGFFRLAAAVELELLLASNVSPLLAVPIQLAFSTSDRFSLGVEGWLGVLDGRDPLGAVGAFVQATGRTPVRALWDVRWAMAYIVAERAVQITSAVSFYPQLW